MLTTTSKTMNARVDSINAERELRFRFEQLNNMLDFRPDTVYNTLDPELPPLNMSDDEIIERFVNQSPDLQNDYAQLVKDSIALIELKYRLRPKLAFTGSYTLSGREIHGNLPIRISANTDIVLHLI